MPTPMKRATAASNLPSLAGKGGASAIGAIFVMLLLNTGVWQPTNADHLVIAGSAATATVGYMGSLLRSFESVYKWKWLTAIANAGKSHRNNPNIAVK